MPPTLLLLQFAALSVTMIMLFRYEHPVSATLWSVLLAASYAVPFGLIGGRTLYSTDGPLAVVLAWLLVQLGSYLYRRRHDRPTRWQPRGTRAGRLTLVILSLALLLLASQTIAAELGYA